MNNTIIELSFSLHDRCNLRCGFCFQPHSKNIDIPYIRNIPTLYEKELEKALNFSNSNEIHIRVYGGELFSDDIPDEIFKEYVTFTNELLRVVTKVKKNGNVTFFWGTNAIFSKRSRVEEVLKSHRARLAPSYDAMHRFNVNQKQIWYDNIRYFSNKNLLSSISIMLIKPCIEKYIHGDDYFNKIDKNIWIDVNQYVPNLNYQEYLPSDDDIYNFYKWCIDTGHFNVSSVGELFSEKRTPCNPLTEFLFFPNLPDQQEWMYLCNMCAPFSKEEYYGEYRKCMCANCPDAIDTARSHKRGCVYCEYNGNCVKMCTLPYMFSKYKMNDVCPIFQILKYIESDDSIIKRYHSWKEEFDRFNDQFSYGDIYEKHVL